MTTSETNIKIKVAFSSFVLLIHSLNLYSNFIPIYISKLNSNMRKNRFFAINFVSTFFCFNFHFNVLFTFSQIFLQENAYAFFIIHFPIPCFQLIFILYYILLFYQIIHKKNNQLINHMLFWNNFLTWILIFCLKFLIK
jgi:hypothetical protein